MMSRMQDSSPAQKTFGELLRDFLFGGEENVDPGWEFTFSLSRGILGVGAFAASSFIHFKTIAITSDCGLFSQKCPLPSWMPF
jgi:hypothetical protein